MLQALSWAALGTGFTFLMTTSGAAVVFFFVEEPRPQFQRTMLGFAAGVMTAASVWSLLLPAIEQSADFGVPGWLPAAAGLLLAARSDYIEVNGRRYPRTPVALSEQPVSDGGGYHALWGAAEERGRGHEAVDVAEAAVAQSAKAG